MPRLAYLYAEIVIMKYNNKDVKISVIATRYTGTDHQYKTVTTNPTHSGGKGGSN